ncbi:MAG: hypothetical protein LQ340_004723, partial [Diploschistes diacapsis]
MFALVMRDFEWLIAGALASALTYSGSAAIHACLLTWRGPASGDLDRYPLMGILSTSCILAVPLINWSSTLRHLGQPKPDPFHPDAKREPGSTRTVIIYWAFLVAVGYLSIFVSFFFPESLPFPAEIPTYSGLDSIQCVPPDNYLNQSAGQMPGWVNFWITTEFINQNNCVEPCSTQTPDYFGGALFRQPSDLVSLTANQLNLFWENTALSGKEQKVFKFDIFYANYILFALPYIIAQGTWAVFFGRKSPANARYAFYHFFSNIHFPGYGVSRLQRDVAKAIAILAYLWAVLILVICVPTFVLNLVATETLLFIFPQGEYLTAIGQWQPWAGTVLIFIAAFIAQFEERFRIFSIKAANNGFWDVGHWWRHSRIRKRWRAHGADTVPFGERPGMPRKGSQAPDPGLRDEASSAIMEILLDARDGFFWLLKDAVDTLAHEWYWFCEFWKQPDIKPRKREKPTKPVKRRALRKQREKDGYYGHASENSSISGKSVVDSTDIVHVGEFGYDQRSHGEAVEEKIKLQPSLLPGGAWARHKMQSFGILEPKHESGTRQGPAGHDDPMAGVGRSVTFANPDTERQRRSIAGLPPAPSLLTNNSRTEVDAAAPQGLPTITTSDSEHPSGANIQFFNASEHAVNHQPSSSVVSSLTSSIANRNRRSHVYSPELSPHTNTQDATAMTSLLHPFEQPTPTAHISRAINPPARPPKDDEDVASVPLLSHDSATNDDNSTKADTVQQPPPALRHQPSLSKSYPLPLHTEFPSSTRSSHLFSDAELRQLYANGTPPVRSEAASPLTVRESRYSDQLGAGSGNGGRNTVSYLQIHSPQGMDLGGGEEVVLRRHP